MVKSASAVRIENLFDSNFHAWKQKLSSILTVTDRDLYLTEVPTGTENDQMSRNWTRGDPKA